MTEQQILSVQGVSKRFGGLVAVGDMSFDMQQGDLLSIIGPNGAGKTTLFNLMTGQLAPSSGQVVFKGRNIAHLPPRTSARNSASGVHSRYRNRLPRSRRWKTP